MEEDDEIGAATQLAIDEAHAISARQISLLHSKLQGRPLNCLPANGRWREEDPFEHASYISNFHYGLQTRPARYTRAALNATVEPVSRGISTRTTSLLLTMRLSRKPNEILCRLCSSSLNTERLGDLCVDALSGHDGHRGATEIRRNLRGTRYGGSGLLLRCSPRTLAKHRPASVIFAAC